MRAMDSFDELMIPTEDGVNIHAWFIKQRDPRAARATVLYFHGNAGNIGYRLANAKQMWRTLSVNVLLVEVGTSERRSAGALERRNDILRNDILLLRSRHVNTLNV